MSKCKHKGYLDLEFPYPQEKYTKHSEIVPLYNFVNIADTEDIHYLSALVTYRSRARYKHTAWTDDVSTRCPKAPVGPFASSHY